VLSCVPFLRPVGRLYPEKREMIVSELQRQIAHAVLAGAGVDAIEEAIIDPAPLASIIGEGFVH
jgi:hypothetical protein